MKDKKGQLKVQQMAFMLMGITLFFVLAGMFVLTVYLSNLQDSAGVLEERNALLLVTKLANSPEFSCGSSFGNQKTNCVDMDKAMALKQNIEEYQGFWDVDNIIIRKIYPSQDKDVQCTPSNYPDCNILDMKGSDISSAQSNFVTLCRKERIEGETENKCEIGKLIVSYGEENE